MSEFRNLTIILTSTVHVDCNCAFQVDKQDRINTYLKSVKQWLEKTNFNIILVENSGYQFPELQEELEIYKDRFEIFSFNPPNPPTQEYLNSIKGGKGGSELYSIHYAFNNSVRARHSLYIIKVTGRFFVPDFESYILQFDLANYSGLRQHNDYRCEIVGSHILHFNYIFNKDQFQSIHHEQDPHIENVYQFRFSCNKDILRCNLFNIEPTQRGGLNEIYSQL
jgi:hypothetical protein